MDSSLPELWQTAGNNVFLPAVGKNLQFYVAFFLLLVGLALTGVFALSKSLFVRQLV
jgi:oligosaccharyltransferase subunit 5